MKKIAILCLTLAAAAAGSAGTARAEEGWSYTASGFTGSFQADPANPNQWSEQVSTGAVYKYTMTDSTPDFTDLYDASRRVTIRLCPNACYVRNAGTGGRFIFLHSRAATLAPPAPEVGPVEITSEPVPAPAPSPGPVETATPEEPAPPTPPAPEPGPAPGPGETTGA